MTTKKTDAELNTPLERSKPYRDTNKAEPKQPEEAVEPKLEPIEDQGIGAQDPYPTADSKETKK
jgi:hypothetical protein